MENDLALMAAGYVTIRIALLAVAGYMIYRLSRQKPQPVRIKSQSNYADERRRSCRRALRN